MTAPYLTHLLWWIDAVQPARPGFAALIVHGRPSCAVRVTGHVVCPALAAAGEVLAVGDQALVQLACEQRDAVHPRMVLKPVAGHADLAAPCRHQNLLIQERPLLNWSADSIDRLCRTGTTQDHEGLRGSTSVLSVAGWLPASFVGRLVSRKAGGGAAPGLLTPKPADQAGNPAQCNASSLAGTRAY
jgi:hypothetical protein